MPALEIHHANGTVKTRELSRTQPLTIGKQPFNDICVPDDGVAAMHCRVLWNKSTFEVTAATGSGVEVNGTSVAHMRLQAGDVVRVGSVDFVYVDEDSDPESHEYQLRDIPETVHRGNPPAEGRQPRPQKPDGRIESKAPPHDDPGKHRQEPDSKPVDDLSLFEGPVYTESQAIEIYGDDDAPASLDSDIAGVKRKPVTGNREPEGKSTAGKRGVAMSLTPRARPGEQDVLRSPLVLGLSLGGLVLVLVTGIFWFLIGREQASRLYDRAVAELNEGQYAQSIASFEMFLQQYAGHSLHRQAERGLGKALVQKEIAGATPAWKRGLEQLQTLIAHHRNDPDFAELKPVLQRHAEEISVVPRGRLKPRAMRIC